MHERIQPHELAAQLANAEYEIVDGQVASTRLANLIYRADCMHGLSGKYEQNEHGYVTVERLMRGNPMDSPYTVGLSVFFHDPHNNQTELGGIRYLDREDPYEDRRATVTIRQSESTEQPLLPDNPAWDVIVGTITRAVETEWASKAQKEGR